MAITKDDITWLEPGFKTPQRSVDEDAKRWEVWADMSGTPWEEKNHFPLASLGEHQGTSAYFLAERMYEIYGTKVRIGIKLGWIA